MAAGLAEANFMIQPSSPCQTRQPLYPPIIAQQVVPFDPSAQYFATAVLLTDEGRLVNGCLEGTKAATGFQMEGSASGLSTVLYAFTNLSITRSGLYSIRLDLYKVNSECPAAGATLIKQLEANLINVSDDRVPIRRLSSGEEELIRRARDAGISLP